MIQAAASILAIYLVLAVLMRRLDKLHHIQAYGPSLPFVSFIGTIRYLFDAYGLIQQGCIKFPDQLFRIRLYRRWVVIVNGSNLLDDLRKAPEDVLSAMEATHELLQTPYTFGETFKESLYHIPIFRHKLVKQLPKMFDDFVDEMTTAFHGVFIANLAAKDWTSFSPTSSVMEVIARVSNRAFVGLPLCRDSEFIDINTKFTISSFIAATFIEPFPTSLRPYVAQLFYMIPQFKKRVAEILEPYISERRKVKRVGGVPDFLEMLMEAAEEKEQSVYNLSVRMLIVNFGAIHTTSSTFVQALLHLAEDASYLELLREEVDSLVRTEGWTYDAIKRMHRVDSFLRESQRMNPLSCIMLQRIVMKPFTFSDGTEVPPGTLLAVPIANVHSSGDYYEDSHIFKPWRFLDSKLTMVQTSRSFLTFGHGKHSCPGRFLASIEMKLLLAQLVYHCDVKLPGDGKRPKNLWIASMSLPPPGVRVLLRKRADVLASI